MAKNFKHLTKTQRISLESYLKIKIPIKQIAELLGVNYSTVYREIKRGEYICTEKIYDEYGFKKFKKTKRYSPDIAQQRYEKNLKDKGADIKLGNDYELAEYIERKIVDEKLSPLAVLGEIKFKNLYFKTTISVNTLYSYISKGVFERLSIKHLPIKSTKKNIKRKLVIKRAPRGTSIEKRPIEILERNTFGHWEMDCVCGPTRNSLLVLTERLTRKEIIIPIKTQSSKNVVCSLNKLEYKYGNKFKKIFKSITVDNGMEFSNVDGLEKSIFNKHNKRTKLYYCHPYCSCERGTNERINREIRRLIPKGTDLSKISDKEVKQVENWVNNYPRQVLNFNTSANLFDYHLSLVA